MYIWEHTNWPKFHWDEHKLLEPLASARLKQGWLLGSMTRLGLTLKKEAQIEALTEDVIKSSEIEGEILDRNSVKSSVARHLGIARAGVTHNDKNIEGVVNMVLDATGNYEVPLTAEQLFKWQTELFPSDNPRFYNLTAGAWRDDAHGPMQVVSGRIGKFKVHYQAPPAEQIDAEVERFLEWFNHVDSVEGLLRAGMAHLWFVTIHPFEDGNGRIARAIADKALAQSEGSAQRFYSMSSQIRKERATYYDILENTQKTGLDITDWLVWFLGCFSRAIDGAAWIYENVLRKADFWQRYESQPFTARQLKVLNKYLDGFKGNLTASKWAALGKCSIASAQRDISDLVQKGVLQRNPGGSKNTSYDVIISGQPQRTTIPR